MQEYYIKKVKVTSFHTIHLLNNYRTQLLTVSLNWPQLG